MQHYAAVTLLAALAGPSPGRIVSSFRLDGKSRVSAGFFATNGTLISTLFSNKEMDGGVHNVPWDWPKGAARDDGLEVRVLAHNVTYEWEGVIGNTGECPCMLERQQIPVPHRHVTHAVSLHRRTCHSVLSSDVHECSSA